MKYSIYTLQEFQNRKKISKECLLLLEGSDFKIMTFTIAPSIDEDDRREMIYEKLSQEYFLEEKDLAYVYYCLLEEYSQSELLFCCYLLKNESFFSSLSPRVVFAVPSFLLGTVISNLKIYYLLDFQETEICVFLYEKQKICTIQKIQSQLSKQEIVEQFLEMNPKKIDTILLGKYTREEKEWFSEYFPIYDTSHLVCKKVGKEVDIFHHNRFRQKKKYRKYFSYCYFIGIFFTIFFGFYWQYKIEALNTELIHLEEKISKLRYVSNVLEEEIVKSREERNRREEELQKSRRESYQIHNMLWKIYEISAWKEILCLECLENKILKLRLRFSSPKKYLFFVTQLLRNKFKFLNHDRIEKIYSQYEVEIEIIEEEHEEQERNTRDDSIGD